MASQTFIAGTGSSISLTGYAWGNPGNVTANDGANATQSGLNGAVQVTDALRGTNFGFSIPSNATIDGIALKIEALASNNTTASAADSVVKLVKGGAVAGNDFASFETLETTATVYTYGGATNLWGTSWSPTDINASNFGAQVQYEIDRTARFACTVSVDYIEITVYYTIATTLTADASSYTLLGIDANFVKGFGDLFNVGTFVLNGIATGLVYSRIFPADTVAYAVAGQGANTLFNRRLTADTGSIVFTGLNNDLKRAWTIFPGSGTYTVTGVNNSLRKTFSALAETSTFALSGVTANVLANRRVLAERGAFTHTGTQIILSAPVSLDADQFEITNFAAFSMPATTVSFAFAGLDTGLLAGKRVVTVLTSYNVTGLESGLSFGRRETVEVGSFALQGVDAELSRSFSLTAELGVYLTTGLDTGFLVTRIFETNTESFTLTGFDAEFQRAYRFPTTVTPYVVTGRNALLVWSRGILADISIGHSCPWKVELSHEAGSAVTVTHKPLCITTVRNYILE